jgi:FG-GAP-like repeat
MQEPRRRVSGLRRRRLHRSLCREWRYGTASLAQRGDGTFAETALDAGVAFADDGKPFAGMGVAFDDYDNDGKPDVAVTNLALEKCALFRNEQRGGAFRYASSTSGLAGLTARSSGWGVKLHADVDNDGWKDLVVTQATCSTMWRKSIPACDILSQWPCIATGKATEGD